MHIGFNTAQWQRQMITHIQSSMPTLPSTSTVKRNKQRQLQTLPTHIGFNTTQRQCPITDNAININQRRQPQQPMAAASFGRIKPADKPQQTGTSKITPIEGKHHIDTPTHFSNAGDARQNLLRYK
jgi:hypothetical protein